jgi:hypothetical protein
MICKNCGHNNFPYVVKCRKCKKDIYLDIAKAQRVRKRLAGSLIVFLIFLVISIASINYNNEFYINNILVILGIISGIIFGFYMINSNKQYAEVDINHEQEKLKEGWRFGTAIIIYSILNVLIFLHHEKFDTITSYIYIPVFITFLLGLLISNIWLVIYMWKLK